MAGFGVPSQTLVVVAKVVVAAAVIGGLISFFRAADGDFWIEVFLGALRGAVIGLGCSVSEIQVFSNPELRIARRLPPVVLMILRAAAYSVFIVFGLAIPWLLADAPPVWRDPDFGEMFAISALVAFAFSSGIEIMRLLGSEATIALVSGRYSRPRLEDRVILFADVVGSTALAERIGDLRFHDFLRDVAQDLAEAVDRTRGNVHRYVGDAMIVTWPLSRGVDRGACLICALEMHRSLARQAQIYRARYGTEATIRVAIHCGRVAAGEIGDWKKEIALLGDTMNTTARIENAARQFGTATVLSDEIVRQLPEEMRKALRHLPEYAAAGKQDVLRLWAADGAR